MHIDLLTRNSLSYSYENYAAIRLKKELEAQGVFCRHFVIGDYLHEASKKRPDWTVAFEDLLGWEKPLCDILQIPHFHWESRSLDNLEHLIGSPNCEIGFHQKQEGIHLLPLPVEPIESQKKLYDTVLFLDLTEKTREFVEALESKVDIFGDHKGANWLRRLKNRDKIFLHRSLPFAEKLRVLAMSRFVIMDKSDALYPFALAAKCLPIAEEVCESERLACLERLTKKVLPQHSWRLSTKRLLECIQR